MHVSQKTFNFCIITVLEKRPVLLKSSIGNERPQCSYKSPVPKEVFEDVLKEVQPNNICGFFNAASNTSGADVIASKSRQCKGNKGIGKLLSKDTPIFVLHTLFNFCFIPVSRKTFFAAQTPCAAEPPFR